MINPSIALYGVAKSATPTPAAPKYSHGLVGGEPFSAEATVETDSVSCGVRAGIDSYKTEVNVASDIETRAYADVSGLYFLAALGDVSTTGASPYTHEFTVGDSLPELIVWSQIDGGATRKIEGCKMDTLELSFDGNNPLTLGITLAGLTGSYGSTTWPGGTVSCFDGYFTCVGSTLKLSANTDTPSVISGDIVTAGEISISNNVEAKFAAGTITPAAIANGKCTVSGSMTINCADESIQRIIETGSTSNTAITGSMVYGSFEWVFQHTSEPTYSLTVSASRVPFTISAMTVDPEGNMLESTLSWDNCLIASAADSPVTITLVNGESSY